MKRSRQGDRLAVGLGMLERAWSVPTASGITQARKRLGRDVMPEIFEGVAEAVATADTRGAWLREWRLRAIDGFEVDLADTPANAELGPVLDSLEPVLDDGGQVADSGGGEVAQAVFHVRPDTLGGVEVRGVGGQLDDGQPVRVRTGERAHHSTDVGAGVVPDQDDRGRQLLVRGGDQAGVIGFGHAAALALAPAVHPHPVEQAAPRLSLRQTSPATGTRPDPLPDTLTTGVRPRGAQVRALGGRRFWPASSPEQMNAPVAAASLVPWPTSGPATRRSPPHHALSPGGRAPAG